MEKEAEQVILYIHSALKAACPRAGQNNRDSALWNDKCRAALRNNHTTSRWGPTSTEKFEPRAKIRCASKESWKSKISGAEDLPGGFKIDKWHNDDPKYESPLYDVLVK